MRSTWCWLSATLPPAPGRLSCSTTTSGSEWKALSLVLNPDFLFAMGRSLHSARSAPTSPEDFEDLPATRSQSRAPRSVL